MDPNKLKSYTSNLVMFVHCIYGIPDSGKTTLMKFLIEKIYNDFDTAYLFSNTPFTNQWEDIFPQSNIFDDYDEEQLKKIVKNALLITEKGKKPPNILLCFDDCVCDFRSKHMRIFKKIILHRRHLNLSVILCNQYIKEFPPYLRNNTDYIHIFSQKSESGICGCYEAISGLTNKENFKKIMRCLPEHGFLMVNYGKSEMRKSKIKLPFENRKFNELQEIRI